MGWDVEQVGSNITTKQYLTWTIKQEFPKLELIKLVEGKNQYGQKPFFAAFKKEDGTIFAAVFLTRRKNGSVAVKIVQESEGPWDVAPASFIKLLTPTTSPFAKEWRSRCVA